MTDLGAVAGPLPLGDDGLVRPRSAWRSVVRSTEGRIGLLILAVVLAVIILGPIIAPYSPTAIGVGPDIAGPSWQHLLGTDELGRDVLSRFLNGGVEVLVIPMIAVSLSLSIGGLLGMIGAYKGGMTDTLVTRLFDLILTLPPLLLVIVLVAAFGTSSVVIVLAVSFVYIPQFGRLVRGVSHAVVTADYVAAAVARGERTPSVLMREMVPNIANPVLAEVALRLTFAIMFVATLDFLGLGTQPPSSAWGLMVADGENIISVAPLVSIGPIMGIAALCVSFSLIADAMSRYLRHET